MSIETRKKLKLIGLGVLFALGLAGTSVLIVPERFGALNNTSVFRADGAVDVLLPFLDPQGNAAMNINVGFAGTPEKIHNGDDSTEWTLSNLTGTGFVASTTAHARQGIATVVAFGSLSGDAVTIDGTDVTNTTLTEGVDWTAATSNNATAISLASAIDGVTGVSATSTGAVVTVLTETAITTEDITTFTSTDTVNLPVSAQSIDASGTVDGDEMLLEDITNIDFSNFTALSASIFITDWSNAGATKNVQLRFRNSGTDVGNSINLSEFVDTSVQDSWQNLTLAKSQFGIDTDTVDEFVVKVIDTTAGDPPDFFLDLLQVEETGTPITYTLDLLPGSTFNLTRMVFTLDATGVSGAGTKPFIDGEEFGFISKLSNGLIGSVTIDGIVTEAINVRSTNDLLGETALIINERWDGSTRGGFSFFFDFGKGAAFVETRGDAFEFIIQDDLSGLDLFTISTTGDLTF